MDASLQCILCIVILSGHSRDRRDSVVRAVLVGRTVLRMGTATEDIHRQLEAHMLATIEA